MTTFSIDEDFLAGIDNDCRFSEFFSDKPEQGEAKCTNCERILDESEIVCGLCEQCAKEMYNDSEGLMFVASFWNDFLDFLGDKTLYECSEEERMEIYKEFCLDDMETWRHWLDNSIVFTKINNTWRAKYYDHEIPLHEV